MCVCVCGGSCRDMRESRETGNKKVNNKQIQIMVIITKKIKQNSGIENE